MKFISKEKRHKENIRDIVYPLTLQTSLFSSLHPGTFCSLLFPFFRTILLLIGVDICHQLIHILKLNECVHESKIMSPRNENVISGISRSTSNLFFHNKIRDEVQIIAFEESIILRKEDKEMSHSLSQFFSPLASPLLAALTLFSSSFRFALPPYSSSSAFCSVPSLLSLLALSYAHALSSPPLSPLLPFLLFSLPLLLTMIGSVVVLSKEVPPGKL